MHVARKPFTTLLQNNWLTKLWASMLPWKKLSWSPLQSTEDKNCTVIFKHTCASASTRDVLGQLLMISQKHISLQKVMCYPLSPVPWALAVPDGLPAKTEKTKLVHLLVESESKEHSDQGKCHYITDAMFHLQLFTSLPSTFGELAERILKNLPSMDRVDFMADIYRNNSIKSIEHSHWGERKTFLLKVPNTKVPTDWKGFIKNGDSKSQLIKFLLSGWRKDYHAAILLNRVLFVTCGTECFKLCSTDGKTVKTSVVQDLSST